MDISYPEKIVYQTPEISIFSDLNNKKVFYYQAIRPSIAKDADQSVISLYIYRSMEGINGGYLAFDVELSIYDEALANAQKYILEKTEQSDIQLRPLQINSSSMVHLDFIGNNNLIKSIQSTYKPSGYGNNRVSFSVLLDKYGAALVKKCIEDKLPLIGITYELSYTVVRKSYSFKASIDWSRTVHYFEKSFSLGLIFFSIDISKAYKELVENRTIIIEKNNYAPKTGSDLIAERQRFEEEIVDFLCRSFFIPVAMPSGNATPILGYSCKTVDVKDIQSKFSSFISEEREFVDSMIYPQAFLENILSDDISQQIKYIDLDESFFTKKTLTIMTNANFDFDNIKYIQVELLLENSQSKSIILNKDDALKKVSWPQTKGISYSFIVFFNDNSLIWTGKVNSSNFISQSNVIIIEPHLLYSIRRIEFWAPSKAIWEKYASIVIEVYWEEKSQPEKSFALSKDTHVCIWTSLRMIDDSKYYNYRIYYKEQNNSSFKSVPQQKSFEDRIIITDYLVE